MRQLQTRRSRIIYFILIVILSAFFTIYYYGIQMGVVPSNEELYSLFNGWLALNKGLDWPSAAEGLYGRLCVWVACFGGVRYGSMRIVWSIFYFLISLVTLDLAMRDNKWNCRIVALPVYILLMVLMHLSGSYLSRYYGKFFYVKDQYPFNFHMGTTLAVLLLMWFVYRAESWRIYNRKSVYYSIYLFVIIGCYLISGTADIVIFFAGGIIPLVVIALRKYILDEAKRNKILLAILTLATVANFAVDFNSDRVLEFYFNYHLYNFISVEGLWNNVLYYIADISGTFNFDVWNRQFEPRMLSEFARIIFLVYIYIIVFKNLRQYFKKENSIDILEQMVSWAFLIISMGFIFTTLGSWDKARYFNILLPYGTIVLCKNIEKFVCFLHMPSKKNFVIVGVLLILLSFDVTWGHYREYNVYDTDLRDINILIDEKGLHDGLGTGKIFPSVTAQGRGKNWVYPAAYDEEKEEFFLEKDIDYTNCFFDFFIVDREDETVLVNDSDSYLMEDIIKIYGQPNERIVLNCYEVWIFREGIDIL